MPNESWSRDPRSTEPLHNEAQSVELESVQEFLSACLPFDTLSLKDIQSIVPRVKIQYFRKGKHFSSDSGLDTGGLLILRNGAAEIRSDSNQLLDRIGEYESFNLRGLNQENENVHAVLIEDALIYELPEPTYQNLRKNNREFDRFFHSQRSRRLRRAARYEPVPHNMLRSVTEFMTTNIFWVTPQTTLQKTAQMMTDRHLSSVLVMQDGFLEGIVTDRDIRSRAVVNAYSVEHPISGIMTPDPKTLPSDSNLFDATLFMTQKKIHHLPIMDQGKVLGIITSSDLMLSKQNDPVYLTQHIKRQQSTYEIQQIISSLPNLFLQWVNSGIKAYQLSHILTAISDAVNSRLIELYCEEWGPAPVAFAWIGFGSQGREEQLLNADQDNGLIFKTALTPEQASWFEGLARYVCDGLNQCGYVYCPGNIMATNETWRQPIEAWKEKVESWTQSPTPKATMHVSIFFDIRCIYGEQSIVSELQQYMLKQAENSIFLAALAQNALQIDPPIGMFRRFVVEKDGEHNDEINLKKRGILPIVDLIRVQALAHQVFAVNTTKRIEFLAKKKSISILDSRNIQDAYSIIMQVRIQHQAQQIANGIPPQNYVKPKHLSKIVRNQLKDAFSIIDDSQQSLKFRFRQGLD